MVRILTAPERERRAAAFVFVCERRGAMTRIAEAWEVSPQFVAKVRDGDLALTDERICKLPQAQREHLFEVMSERAQLKLF